MMKFRKNQNKKNRYKEKKTSCLPQESNPHKKVVILPCGCTRGLVSSFAIFKHFTAIDTHTIANAIIERNTLILIM